MTKVLQPCFYLIISLVFQPNAHAHKGQNGFQNRIHRRKVFSRPRGIEPAWDEVSGINQTVHGYIGRMQVLGEDGFQICNIYFFGGYGLFEPNAHAHKGQSHSSNVHNKVDGTALYKYP